MSQRPVSDLFRVLNLVISRSLLVGLLKGASKDLLLPFQIEVLENAFQVSAGSFTSIS